MPTYEYTCTKCGHCFEQVQSMSSATLETCPKEKCAEKKWGKGKVKRGVGGGAGLIFKGSGFYITDYRSENYKNSAKKDSAPAATPSTPATTTSTPASTPSATPAKPSGAKGA